MFDFSKDALLPQANKTGTTPVAMGNLAEQQMKDRVVSAAMSNPNTLQTGAQMGSVQTGTGVTPITFQAFTRAGQAPTPSVTPPAAPGASPMPSYVPNAYNGGTGGTGTPPAPTPGTGTGVSTPPSSTGGSSSLDATNSKVDALMGQLQTPEQIQADLDYNIKIIESKYADEERDLRSKFENHRGEQFSNLAGVGMGLNPLSSGASSINSSIDRDMNDAIDASRLRKNLEIQAAKAAAQGQKTDAIERQITEAKDREEKAFERAQTTAKQRNDDIATSLATMNAYSQKAKSDKELSTSEKEDSFNTVQKWFTLFGSSAFDGTSASDILALERASGLPAGSISTAAKTLKEQEIEAKKNKPASGTGFKYYGATKYSPAVSFDPVTGAANPLDNISTPPSADDSVPGDSSDEEAAFQKVLRSTQLDLYGGKIGWGDAFNRIKQQYPDVDDNQIDALLGTDWREPGAYEKFAATQQQYRGTPKKTTTDDENLF